MSASIGARAAYRRALVLLLASILLGWTAMLVGVKWQPTAGWIMLTLGIGLAAGSSLGRPDRLGPRPSSPPLLQAERRLWHVRALHALLFTSILLVAAGLFFYRLTENPGQVDFYGGGAMLNAERVLEGRLAPSALVPFFFGTQADCVHSLLFVAWHALFQLAFGGLTLIAGRMAGLTATLLSVALVYSVGRRLLGPGAGLSAMAVFACQPTTVVNGRSETVFGFSTLLILLVAETALAFGERPTWWKALLLGVLLPTVFYGIANIRAMIVAPLVFLVLRFGFEGPRRLRNLLLLLASIGLSAVFLIPALRSAPGAGGWYFKDWNGEQIFSPLVDHDVFSEEGGAVFLEPLDKEIVVPPRLGKLGRRLLVVRINLEYLLRAALGLLPPLNVARGTEVHFASLGVIPMLVGLVLCLSRLRRPETLFLTLLFVGSYGPPLVSIFANGDRCMVLGPAQALLVGAAAAEVLSLGALAGLRRPLASFLIAVPLAAICLVDLASSTWLLTQNPGSSIRRFLLRQAAGLPVFLQIDDEVILNYLSWNRPSLGRDSTSRTPLVFLHSQDLPEAVAMTEALDLPAIVCGVDPRDFADGRRSGWTPLETSIPSFPANLYRRSEPARAWIGRLDLLQLSPREALGPDRAGNLERASCGLARHSGFLRVPDRLDHAAVLAHFLARSRQPHAVEVEVSPLPPVTLSLSRRSQDRIDGAGWADLGGPLLPGEHCVKLTVRAPDDGLCLDDLLVVGRSSGPSR